MIDKQPKDFLSPLTAGIGLGLVLLASFLMTGHGLGASGFFARFGAWLSQVASPAWADVHIHLQKYLSKGHPLDSWISWEIAGVALGALVASLWAGRWHFKIERGANIKVSTRLGLAVLGGILTGFGAQLARGCTSGLGLSGGATLAVAAFIFLIAFFVAGLLVSKLTWRNWQ